MTTFALRESLAAGPPRVVATFADPRVACIAAYRRCRMTTPEPELTTHWAGVDILTDDGRSVPLVELRRVKGGVKIDPPDYAAIHRALPGFQLEHYFALTETDGRLMIEGQR